MRSPFLLGAIIASPLSGSAQLAPQVRDELWTTNGPVECMATHGDSLFIGGPFTEVARPLCYATLLSQQDGGVVSFGNRPNGGVSAIIPDGNGGFYLGGGFTKYAYTDVPGVLHLDASGALLPWLPNAPGYYGTTCMALSDDQLFISNYNSVTAVSITSGSNIGWDLEFSGNVRTMAVRSGVLYLGGDFTNVGGQSRNRLAAVDAATGAVLPWQVNCDNNVECMLAEASGLVIGGAFTTLSGFFRDHIAQLDYATGIPNAWDPGPNGQVRTLLSRNDTLYLGGYFTNLAGQDREGLAALLLSTGEALPWVPAAEGDPKSLSYWNGKIHMTGITSINGVPRDQVAVVDAVSGALDPWTMDLDPDGTIQVIAANDELVIVGGGYARSNVTTRTGFAALDMSTAGLLPWAPPVLGDGSSALYALHVVDNKLFLGGTITEVDGIEREHLACIDLSTHQVTPWSPSPSGVIYTIDSHNGRLYIGGSFGTVAGMPRSDVASFDLASMSLTAWVVDLNGVQRAIAFMDERVYLEFYEIRVFDEITGLEIPFMTGSMNGNVYDMEVHNGLLYFVGSLTQVYGEPRYNAAACDAMTGALSDWDPSPFGTSPCAVAVDANSYANFIGGSIPNIGGIGGPWSGSIVALDGTIGAPIGDPESFNLYGVKRLQVNDTLIIAGGTFDEVEGYPRQGIALFHIQDLTTSQPTEPFPRTEQGLVVWPVPITNGPVYFSTPIDAAEWIAVQLIDTWGRILRVEWSSSNRIDHRSIGAIENPYLSPGTYTLRVQTSLTSYCAKLVVF